MKILVVGATGTIGKAVVAELASRGHEVLEASRKGKLQVDIQRPESIKALYAKLGKVDGVVSCAGDAAFGPLGELTDDKFTLSLENKLMGQVNLVRFGVDQVNDNGFFVLTAGIFSRNPMPGASAIAMANGALESFARGAALDLPRGIRINAISPPFITETAKAMGFPTDGTMPAKDNAKAYAAVVEGKDTGKVVFPGD
jgi:NAD(P)-dependent dehydrogenase (short-subunit alcohol dehydrogenase family)